jgi:hypothetical protein
LNLKPQQVLNVRDKMPLEVTPIYYRLSRYSPPEENPPPSGAPSSSKPAVPGKN